MATNAKVAIVASEVVDTMLRALISTERGHVGPGGWLSATCRRFGLSEYAAGLCSGAGTRSRVSTTGRHAARSRDTRRKCHFLFPKQVGWITFSKALFWSFRHDAYGLKMEPTGFDGHDRLCQGSTWIVQPLKFSALWADRKPKDAIGPSADWHFESASAVDCPKFAPTCRSERSRVTPPEQTRKAPPAFR